MAVEFYRDTYGIPHIRASSEEELVFAQGYNVALDRPLQIEVERHRAMGTTASFLGPDSVSWDVFARQAKIEDTAYRCFRNLRPSTRAWVRAYVAGVNRGLETAPNLLADHGIPRGRWAPWAPLAIWLSRHILFTGFPSKLWREEVAMKLGPSRIHLFSMEGASGSGSNGWLIPGPRTASGAAILAGDPHLVIEEPGAYQQLRLSCPAYDVVGFAAPGVPGLPHYAHAGTVAWGITRAMAETQDLYREELRRVSGSLEARGPQGFRPVSVETQFIEVLGEDPVPTEIVETDRGVVIVGGPDEDVAISLRHPARFFGSLGFDAIPELLRSRTVADVKRSFQLWVDPVNVVQAADVKGGLLHQVIGTVPVRSEKNMLRVVSAWEPQCDWIGEVQNLPKKIAEGPVVMANQRGIVGTLGVEFASEHRAQRIETLLESREKWAPDDMAMIHGDTQLDSASPLLDSLSKLTELSPQSVSLRERLLGWDRRMEGSSKSAALFAQVRSAVVRQLAAQPAWEGLDALCQGKKYPDIIWPWLELTPRIAFAMEKLLSTYDLPGLDPESAVRRGLEEVAQSDGHELCWQDLHKLTPWQALPQETGSERPGLSGDSDCVLATYSTPGFTHGCLRGPAMRYVWDLKDREKSLWVLPFGASSPPGKTPYDDQLKRWTNCEYLPIETAWEGLKPDFTLEDPTRRICHFEQQTSDHGIFRIMEMWPERDIDHIYGWVSQERARYWGMLKHSRERVLEIYDYLDSLPTHHPYLIYHGKKPVALLQIYRPENEPLGRLYDSRPGDRGFHLLVAPPTTPVHGFTSAIMSLSVDFIFSNPAIDRIVAEPDCRNEKMLTLLERHGFHIGSSIEMPEKTARFVSLSRVNAQTV